MPAAAVGLLGKAMQLIDHADPVVTREQLAASAMAYVEAGEVQGACVICVELQLQDWIPAEWACEKMLKPLLLGNQGGIAERYGKLCPVVQAVLYRCSWKLRMMEAKELQNWRVD